jgi:hypothetical protein
VHYPVYNRNREVVTTSVTTLDVHDLSRVCRTYGFSRLYVSTPLKAQQELVKRISRHWVEGAGAELNPSRKSALARVRVADTVQNILLEFEKAGESVRTVATGARKRKGSLTVRDFLKRTAREKHLLFLFGTGWGLERSLLDQADFTLDPIYGTGHYNHLPVRSAVAILLDRLYGRV